jgi:hypothetical protein
LAFQSRCIPKFLPRFWHGHVCRTKGIYIFAIITVGTSLKDILMIDLTVLPFLSETQFKIVIFADVAHHGSIGGMPREHHRAKFRPCPCLQLPSSTDMWDPHVSVVFNLKPKAGACMSGHRPISCARRPSPGPMRPLPVVAAALAPSGRQSSSTASKIRSPPNAVHIPHGEQDPAEPRLLDINDELCHLTEGRRPFP